MKTIMKIPTISGMKYSEYSPSALETLESFMVAGYCTKYALDLT